MLYRVFHKKINILFIIFLLIVNFIAISAYCDENLQNDINDINENVPRVDTKNLDEIYNSLEMADFEYIFGIDPNQADEYTKYMFSPYPLFRTGVNLVFKDIIIPQGYYLLTPREKNGKTYVLFKQNGRVQFVIPTYKTDDVALTFYDDKLPHKRKNAYEKIVEKSNDFLGKKFGHRTQRTPIPKAYIEFSDKGSYWDMVLYWGFKKYYLLFKKD